MLWSQRHILPLNWAGGDWSSKNSYCSNSIWLCHCYWYCGSCHCPMKFLEKMQFILIIAFFIRTAPITKSWYSLTEMKASEWPVMSDWDYTREGPYEFSRCQWGGRACRCELQPIGGSQACEEPSKSLCRKKGPLTGWSTCMIEQYRCWSKLRMKQPLWLQK